MDPTAPYELFKAKDAVQVKLDQLTGNASDAVKGSVIDFL